MYSVAKNISILFIIMQIIFNVSECADRSIKVTINPNCNECNLPDSSGSYNNIIYVRADGQNDTFHVLISDIQSFSIMIFKTDLDDTLQINSSRLLSKNTSQMFNSIKFSKNPSIESFGYTFPIIYEFNDTLGTADLTQVPANQTIQHLTSNLKWNKFVELSNTSGQFEGSLLNNGGSFKFIIRYPGKDMRDTELPSLLLNAESLSCDFIVDSIQPTYSMAKFGLNVVFLTNNTNATMANKRTLDDEYTPATFKLWHVEIRDSMNNVHNYLQWRPIFYYFSPKNVENATITHQYNLGSISLNDSSKNGDVLGIGSVFYPTKNARDFYAMNVSFGIEGNEKDGYFYKQTNYSIWTFSVGMGQAPDEKMSYVVTLVIIIGFGLPALVILIGLLVMIVRKIRGGSNANYSQFQQL